MKKELSDALIRRRHLRRGIICIAIGVFCGASIIIGWIVAKGDPNFYIPGVRGSNPPIWVATLWVGGFGAALLIFGISQLRSAALFRKR